MDNTTLIERTSVGKNSFDSLYKGGRIPIYVFFSKKNSEYYKYRDAKLELSVIFCKFGGGGGG